MTHSGHCHKPVFFRCTVLLGASTVLLGSHTAFSVSSLPQPCHVALTSSGDDEHNTDNNFLLLFADVGITPTLLEGLTEVDVLHIALGCRFALDISRFRSHIPLHLITSHFLTILGSLHFASLLGPRSWKGTHTLSLSLCGRNSWLHSVNSRHVDLHRSCTARFG